jgi:hypothetical protein
MPRSALKSCRRRTERGAGTGRQLRAQRLEIARENTTHSQETQHFRPTPGHNIAGRNRQPLAPPRVMADAGGGMVVKPHVPQLDIVQDTGDDAAHRGDADLVAALQNSCWPSRTPMKKQTRILQIKNNPKIHLTRYSFCTLLFCCRAAASAFAPSSPTWLQPCKTHVGPHAR